MTVKSERCELSDLPVDQCACRLHAKPEPKIDYVVMARFPAHFNSKCDSCGKSITEGEYIARTTDGEYVCNNCSPD